MKTFIQVVVWMLLAAIGGAYGADATPDLVGQWRGSLPVDAKTNLTIQFDIARRPDGGYVVVLDSPDNGAIKNTPASKVTLTEGRLQFEVPSLSGSYAGALRSGTLAGEWKQATGTLPLNLTPYRAPQLTQAAIDTLKGSWVGPLTLPGVKLTLIITFRVDGKGALTGTLRSPDQGGGEAALTSIEFKDNHLTARAPGNAIDFDLMLEGDTFNGKFKQGGPEGMPLSLKKGEYVAPVYPLSADAEAKAQLAGKWSGQITPPPGGPPGAPTGPRRVTVSFKHNDKGQFVGAIEFPDPPRTELPVLDLLLNGSKLTLKAGPNGVLQYSGDLAGKTITGEWAAGPNKVPLVLTRN